MRKLFLHIGSPKAASTSIQSFLFQNSGKFRRLGYSVSDSDLNFGGGGDNPLWFFEAHMKEERESNGSKILLEKVRRIRTENAVISAENLSNPRAPQLFSLVGEEFEIYILFLTRRQDDWIYSGWKQWFSKTGQSLEFFVEDAIRKHIPNYPETVQAWQNIVPIERIKIASLELLKPITIEELVLNWLGIEQAVSGFDIVDGQQNESFDFRIVDLLSRHPGVFNGAHDRRIDELLTYTSKLSLSHKYCLPTELSTRVLDHFFDDNVNLFGKEQTALLHSKGRGTRVEATRSNATDDHDFIIACLLEALGNVYTELVALKTKNR